MGEPVAKPVPGMARDAPKARKPGNLAFGQRALLIVGITVLGGAPSYLMARGSAPEQQWYGAGPSMVMNTAETAGRQLREACTVKEEPKPQMAIQGKGKE